jgi:hypothetical protein
LILRGVAAAVAIGTWTAPAAAAPPAKPPAVTVTAGRYGPYYHLPYELTAAAIDFERSDGEPRDGGQFEIRVQASRFPIAAPKCRGAIVIRMPWTAPDAGDAATKIAAKHALLQRIRALQRAPEATVPVTLELNPYVEVVKRSPLRLALTRCNVFFRHRDGAYVDTTAR